MFSFYAEKCRSSKLSSARYSDTLHVINAVTKLLLAALGGGAPPTPLSLLQSVVVCFEHMPRRTFDGKFCFRRACTARNDAPAMLSYNLICETRNFLRGGALAGLGILAVVLLLTINALPG
jgi:hypothetical protein